MSDWAEYGPADLKQAREEGRQQGLRDAAEIARRFAMFNNRHENGGEYSDGVEETCDAVSAMIEAKAGENP